MCGIHCGMLVLLYLRIFFRILCAMTKLTPSTGGSKDVLHHHHSKTVQIDSSRYYPKSALEEEFVFICIAKANKHSAG